MKNYLDKLFSQKDLSCKEIERFLYLLTEGHFNEEQISAFIAALQTKGITPEEFVAAFHYFDQTSSKFLGDLPAIHIMGTGKSRKPFNVSTCAALIASLKVPVVKKTARAISSSSGSADLLEALGLTMQSSYSAKESLQKNNICFFYTQLLHPAFGKVHAVRRSLGAFSLFDLIAAFLSAGRKRVHLVGVNSEKSFLMLKEAFKKIELFDHLLLVHGLDGMDEISISAPTKILEVKKGECKEFLFKPIDFGLKEEKCSCMKNSFDSSETLLRILEGEEGPCTDLAALNAGALFYLGDVVQSLKEGYLMAKELVIQKIAFQKLLSLKHWNKELFIL